MQFALTRAGAQPFQVVADLLRTLDRPGAFLQQAASALPVRRADPVAIESGDPAAPSDRTEPHTAPQAEGVGTAEENIVRAMVQEAVQKRFVC